MKQRYTFSINYNLRSLCIHNHLNEIIKALKSKRIIITGGPGSGKTSIINHIETLGYNCMHEVSRQVIKEARKAGIEQLFLTDPMLFSHKLMASRLKQFQEAENIHHPKIFYDRGMPDVTSYLDYIGTEYPSNFEQPCFENNYDLIFILPPWKEIYTQDNERYETFEQAIAIHNHLFNGYEKYGYTLKIVPEGTIEKRVSFILKNTAQ
ncbi:AAA family ATPase [Patiriisocius sp. Uisw_017]|jgi:predicted ATPase|uniref:AAA family ATPase n=1 Tax=Patiriisocius sp. Uisw_017 TaxID=3230968 RepID=UPI0039EB1541